MADEIELKLELTGDAAARIEASGLLPGDPRKVRQRSIYFDTPDRDLARAGFSLRIRRSGRKRIQTVKASGAGAAGLFVRSEWERAVTDDNPVLDCTTPLATLLGDALDAVAPAFEVKIDRHEWIVVEGDAIIELVLDRGEVVAGERRSPVCEIELELKSGDPAALFALARRIDTVVPVRLGVVTKSERGYRLIAAASAMARAERIQLDGEATVAQAFRRIVQSCIRQFRLNEAVLLTEPNPEALHQARVALRRLRSALSIFRPMIGADGVALGEDLRWLASELGNVRNLDMLLERAGHGSLHDRIAAARTAAYEHVHDVLLSARVRGIMLDLAEWAATANWSGSSGGEADGDQPARGFAVAALDRFRRKVKRKGRRLAHLDDEARHALRKHAKKLRYAAEFFAPFFGRKREQRRYKRFIKALEALQDRLGALNDLVTARAVLTALGVEGPAASTLFAEDDKGDLVDAAADAQEDLVDTRRFW